MLSYHESNTPFGGPGMILLRQNQQDDVMKGVLHKSCPRLQNVIFRCAICKIKTLRGMREVIPYVLTSSLWINPVEVLLFELFGRSLVPTVPTADMPCSKTNLLS